MAFTHLDKQGRPTMVDVGAKPLTERMAIARAIVSLPPEVANKLSKGDISTTKGAVFSTAVLAGIQAAKRTPELIPLCHMVPLDDVSVEIKPKDDGRQLVIDCQAKATHKTGVEMEAMIGASITALTIYDMTKALSRDIVVEEVRLIEKKGGKSDFKQKT